MTYDEIRAAMGELVKEMMAKGVKRPTAGLEIKNGSCDQVNLWCDSGNKIFEGDYLRIVYGQSPIEAIAAARAYIAALPDPATEGERKFTRKLAEAVDIATEYALPDAVVAPVKTAIREVNAALLGAA